MEEIRLFQDSISGKHVVLPSALLHSFLDFLTGPAPGVREVCAAVVFCHSIQYCDVTDEAARLIAARFDDGVNTGRDEIPSLIYIDVEKEEAGQKLFSRSGLFRCLLNASDLVIIVLYFSVVICSSRGDSERRFWSTIAHYLIDALISGDISGLEGIDENFLGKLKTIPVRKHSIDVFNKLITCL